MTEAAQRRRPVSGLDQALTSVPMHEPLRTSSPEERRKATRLLVSFREALGRQRRTGRL